MCIQINSVRLGAKAFFKVLSKAVDLKVTQYCKRPKFAVDERELPSFHKLLGS